MGVLKKITDEYFDKTMRSEEYVKFNFEKMKPVDMGGSVLWADRDLEKEDGGAWLKYDKHFTYNEVVEMKLKDGWRLPSFDEFAELYRSMRNVNVDSTYHISDVSFVTDNKEVLKFETMGYYNHLKDGYLSHASFRMTMDINETPPAVCVFDVYKSTTDVILIEKDKKKRQYVGKENIYVPVRLVKDKK